MKVCLACDTYFRADNRLCPACGTRPLLKDGFLAFAPELAQSSDGFEASFFQRLAQVEAEYWIGDHACRIRTSASPPIGLAGLPGRPLGPDCALLIAGST
jgi:hypothetical protein